MQKINIDKIYSYFLLLFCFILPLSGMARAVPNIILIVLAVLLPFHNLRKSFQIIKKELIAILLFISIIVINTALFSRWEDTGEIIRFMYIPLILLLFFSIEDIKPYIKSFLIGTFLILFLSSIRIALMYINEGNFEIVEGDKVNKILLGERPYLGFLYFMAACFSFYFYTSATKNINRIIYSILIILFCFFIFLIAARLALIVVVISSILALFYFRKKIKFNYKIGLLLSLFLIGLLYTFSVNISERLYIEKGYKNFIVAEPRYYIWNCVYDILPDNSKDFVFGKGDKNIKNELLECYANKDIFISSEQREWFLNGRLYKTHNQFIDLLLGQGIIVFILCLFFFVYEIIKNRNNFFATSLLLSIFLFFSVENVLKTQLGCMIVALVLCFIFKNKKSTSTDNPAT